MRFARFITAIILATVLIANVGVASASASKSNQSTAALSKPASTLTQADLELVADLMVMERITVPKAANFISKLNPEQLRRFEEIFCARLGVQCSELKQDMTVQPVRSGSSGLGAAGDQLMAPGAAWADVIENVWTWNYNPKIFAHGWYEDWNCDDDPADKEFVFVYAIGAHPVGTLRWTTTSPLVYGAFGVAYGWNLLGFGYNFNEVRLCIGDRGVAAAGGAGHVGSTVFVHH
jgi:hypothetical protein